MKDLEDFIVILNSECDALKSKGLMLSSVSEPWRFYSAPIDGEHEYGILRSVLESGKFVVEAELSVSQGDELDAFKSLVKAQGAMLKSLSSHGKGIAKKKGNASGGKSKFDDVHYQIFCIADDLLEKGASERGLARKISDRLTDYQKSENQVLDILKKQKHMLVNR